MRLSFVLPGLRLGGAERMVVTLALAARARGWSVQVLCTTRGGELEIPLREAGVMVEVLGLAHGAELRAALSARSRLREFSPQLVHSHLAVGDIVAAAAFPRASRLVTIHNPGVELSRLKRTLWGASLYGAHVRTAVSARAAKAAPWRVDHVIYPSFVDEALLPEPTPELRCKVRRELGVSEHQKLVVAAGRRTPVKGIDVLASAAELLTSQDRAASIHHFGEGPFWFRHAPVEWHPPRMDLLRILSAADLFLQTSRSEGFPQATLEAMWCGTPVVATDVGGTRELVTEADLVPAESPRCLADRAMERLRDPAQARARAHASRTLLRRRGLTQASMLSAFFRLYEDMNPA